MTKFQIAKSLRGMLEFLRKPHQTRQVGWENASGSTPLSAANHSPKGSIASFLASQTQGEAEIPRFISVQLDSELLNTPETTPEPNYLSQIRPSVEFFCNPYNDSRLLC